MLDYDTVYCYDCETTFDNMYFDCPGCQIAAFEEWLDEFGPDNWSTYYVVNVNYFTTQCEYYPDLLTLIDREPLKKLLKERA